MPSAEQTAETLHWILETEWIPAAVRARLEQLRDQLRADPTGNAHRLELLRAHEGESLDAAIQCVAHDLGSLHRSTVLELPF